MNDAFPEMQSCFPFLFSDLTIKCAGLTEENVFECVMIIKDWTKGHSKSKECVSFQDEEQRHYTVASLRVSVNQIW